MKKLNSVEIKARMAEIKERRSAIIAAAKKEVRELTEAEEQELGCQKEELATLNSQLDEIKKRLDELENEKMEAENPEDNADLDDVKKDPTDEPAKEQKNKNSNSTMKNSIVKEIRKALANGTKAFSINADMEIRATTVTGNHTVVTSPEIVETKIENILEPLYAESALGKLGVRWYTGLPMGDVSVPVMGKGTVGWKSETAAATVYANTFTNVTLSPHRLTAFVDISNQLIAQDTVGVEAAIRRDIVTAISDKFEATIFGDAAIDDAPAGILSTGILNEATAITTFADLCNAEAKVEAANVIGAMKYLMNPSAKAVLRAMAKSSKNTQLVLEGGEVDGVPAVVTSNVATTDNKKVAIYGNFDNLAVASWGQIDIKVDEYTQAINGCTRLIVTAYFDAKPLRKEAFAVVNL